MSDFIMFNGKNGASKTTASKMNTNSTGTNHPSVNMISEGTHLKGTLQTKNDIRVAGTLEGEAKAEGKIIITSSGKIKGNLNAVDADIAGRLEGEIRINNKLILRQSAVIDGDIYAKSLLVEEGAQINGACRMSENISLNKKGSAVEEDEKSAESKLKVTETQTVE